MRLLIPLILFPLITFCQVSKIGKDSYYFPAEWEPQRGMIISFDNELNADSVSVNMVKALSPAMKVYCMIVSDSLKPYYNNWFQKESIRMDNIRFMLFGNSGTPSIRDPIFFLKNNNHEYKIMDFRWSLWGYLPDSIYRQDYLKWLRDDRKNFNNNFLSVFPFSTVQSDMAIEGGAIEVNGKGVLLQVEAVNMDRNPNLSKTEQEKELKRVLGVSKVIWLKEGPADDPDGDAIIAGNYFGNGVNGHVDEFCRFANAKTIFLAHPGTGDTLHNPVGKITWERMMVNEKILQNATDQDGKHFEIVNFPIPDFDPTLYILDTTSTNIATRKFSYRVMNQFKNFRNYDTCYFAPAASYLNYLVSNNKVLIPKYWKEGKPASTKQKDEMARKLFIKYFPGKEIIQVNPTGLNYRGGGMHCWSQQLPD